MISRRTTMVRSIELVSSKDTIMELNRSIAVFLATTKLLTFAALLIFVLATDDMVLDILLIEDEFGGHLSKIPQALKVIITVVLIQLIITSMCCIYGHARMNRHLLAFVPQPLLVRIVFEFSFAFQYGYSLFLMLMWMIFFVAATLKSDNRNIPRIKLFKRFDANWKTRYAVQTYEERYNCCGSEYHKLDSPIYKECPFRKDFDLCLLDKATLYSSVEEQDMLEFLCWLSLGGVLVITFEAVLCYHMVYLLGQRWEENLLYVN